LGIGFNKGNGEQQKGKKSPSIYSGGQNKNYEQTLTLYLWKATSAFFIRSFRSLPSVKVNASILPNCVFLDKKTGNLARSKDYFTETNC